MRRPGKTLLALALACALSLGMASGRAAADELGDQPAEDEQAVALDATEAAPEGEVPVEGEATTGAAPADGGSASDGETPGEPAPDEMAPDEPAPASPAPEGQGAQPSSETGADAGPETDATPFVPSGDSLAGHEGNSFRFQDGQPIPTDGEGGLSAMASEFVMWKRDSSGNYISSNGKAIVGAKRRGIDLSEWNGHISEAQWRRIKADDISFVILRCGGTYYGSKQVYDDSEFAWNAAMCEKLSIPYGVYFFSAAENVAQAWQEANYTISVLEGRKVTLPVYYDLEWEGVGSTSNRTMLANISKVFCNAVQAAGFTPGVYASLSWWDSYLTDSCFDSWSRWVAQYYSSCQYGGSYRLWQATSVATVDGLGPGVDLNFDFTDGSQDGTATGTGKNPLEGMICANPPSTLKAGEASANVTYRAHVQNVGWQGAVSNGATAGISGKSYRVEAPQVDIGGVSGDISYRTQVQDVGWLPWMSNGQVSGTADMGYRVEALQLKLTGEAANRYDVYYRAHVQNVGWQGWVRNGATAGTTGRSLRVEAIQIALVPKGETVESALGAPTVSYRAHVQNVGWQGWVRNGATAGTTGRSLRVEAIQIVLVPKGETVESALGTPTVSYRAHVQNVGWQGWARNGATAGTTGRSLRVEALGIELSDGVSGDISYRAHVQNVGWQGWVRNGATAGTTGRSLRVEALQVELTGEVSNRYDVYYRAHVQNVGWQGWVKNGATAGTTGQSLRVEAVQVALMPKGSGAPTL